MVKNNNVVTRLFNRQICTPAPGTIVHIARQFCENLVPSYTIYDVECPDHLFCKFTDDGRYLISFSRNHQDLIIYRPKWLSYSCKIEDCDALCLSSMSKRFDGFFSQLFCVPLASDRELICKDLFLYLENYQFGLFATSTSQMHGMTASSGALSGIPSIDKITFHLLSLEDGVMLDEKIFANDFIHLAHSTGVFLYDDLLAIVSLRYQTVHILQVRRSGQLVALRTIGPFCREDDELFLKANDQVPRNYTEAGVQALDPMQGNGFLSGIKQRLLSFIIQEIWNGKADHHTEGLQYLQKQFYFFFQDYVDLVIWKVQFLDRHHLLIKFCSIENVISRNADHHPALFAVYNMETTEIIAIYWPCADELSLLFERFFDHFHAASGDGMHFNFVSSHSNNVYALEQLKCLKSKPDGSSQFSKKVMASLPFSCQSRCPSPYLDLCLFRYDEKLISTDRHKQYNDHAITFTSRRQPCSLRFKLRPGPEGGNPEGGQGRKMSVFLFHPHLPLVLSIQQSLLHQSIMNIHFRM